MQPEYTQMLPGAVFTVFTFIAVALGVWALVKQPLPRVIWERDYAQLAEEDDRDEWPTILLALRALAREETMLAAIEAVDSGGDVSWWGLLEDGCVWSPRTCFVYESGYLKAVGIEPLHYFTVPQGGNQHGART